MTPGQYLKLRRAAAGLSVADVAARFATEPRMAEHLRADWLEKIEADIMPARFDTIVALHCTFPFDLMVLSRLAAIAMGADEPAPHVCRICACSWNDACVDEHQAGCWWVELDLCSAHGERD